MSNNYGGNRNKKDNGKSEKNTLRKKLPKKENPKKEEIKKKPPKKKPSIKKKPLTKKASNKGFLYETKISEKGYDSFFILRIYNNTANLAAAANEYYRENNQPETVFGDDFAGLVIEPKKLGEQVDLDGNTSINFALCLLSRDDLSYSIIAHECLHLALSNERLLKRYNGGYPNQDVSFGYSHEERLSYCLEAYVSGVIEACRLQKFKIDCS
jgi:hypothetical protein